MNITKELYEQTCKALDDGYRDVIISKAKRSFINNQAKGPGFYIVSLKSIKSNFEKNNKNVFGHFLPKYEIVKLNNLNIKISDLRKYKISKKNNKKIPSLMHHSTDLKIALRKKIWFLDTKREPHFIFVDWNNFPGVFTYSIEEQQYSYNNKKIPPLMQYSTNLKIALRKKIWFLDEKKELHFIFVDNYWDSFPGVFTYSIKYQRYFYKDISIKIKNLDNLKNLLKGK